MRKVLFVDLQNRQSALQWIYDGGEIWEKLVILYDSQFEESVRKFQGLLHKRSTQPIVWKPIVSKGKNALDDELKKYVRKLDSKVEIFPKTVEFWILSADKKGFDSFCDLFKDRKVCRVENI